MLGGLKVQREETVACFRTKKTASLLAYLAYYADRSISKELLAEALWPDVDGIKGRQSLRMAVSSIRAALEQPDWNSRVFVLSDRDTIEVAATGFWTDARVFRDLVGANSVEDLLQAVDLYRGPLLAGFTDDWILPQSLELEELYSQAVCRLVQLLSDSNRLPAAVSAGRAALSLCPTREELHIALIRAYGNAGQSAAAVKQYEELERMLDEQWGESPSDEAKAVLEGIPKGGASIAGTDPSLDPHGNLPWIDASASLSESTPFFGRENEVAELKQMLSPQGGPRLVTLIGLGGMGKTRLAQRLAFHLKGEFLGRVWFVTLAGVLEAERMLEVLLESIGKRSPRGADALGSVSAAIGDAAALLVLDNVEQIAQEAKLAAARLIADCARLKILVTSRIALDAEGERPVQVTPLPLPTDYRELAALRSSPSVQMLVDAAQSVRPGFGVTPANALSVLLLCSKLEGIPLAIELAAAKLATLTPAQVLASIGRRVDLVSDKAALPKGHQSLRTVAEWSIGLLEDQERLAFAKLSVCRGGFNIELARAILGESAEPLLQKFCRSSLIGWKETAEEVRFEMLETLREIAAETLGVATPAHREAAKKHWSYVKSLCSDFDSLETESERKVWAARLNADCDNVLSVLESGLAGLIEPQGTWEVAWELTYFIERRGRPHVWIAPLTSLLRATESELSSHWKARAHRVLARAFQYKRDVSSAYAHTMQSIEHADRTDDVTLRIRNRVSLSVMAQLRGDFEEARQAARAAIELQQDDPQPDLAASCQIQLGWAYFHECKEAEAEEEFRQAVALAEGTGQAATLGVALTGLACATAGHDYDAAQPLFDRAMAVLDEEEVPLRTAQTLCIKAWADYRNGNHVAALSNVVKGFRKFKEADVGFGQLQLMVCGYVLSGSGRIADAAKFWGAAFGAVRRFGMVLLPSLKRDYEQERKRAIAALAVRDLELALERSVRLSEEDLIEHLLSIEPHRSEEEGERFEVAEAPQQDHSTAPGS